MNKIKILIINTVPFSINGISSVIMNYYKYMDKSELSIDIVANNEINEIYADQLNNNYFMLYNRKRKPFSYIKNLSEIIKKGGYDIVHIHGNSALMQVELEAVRKSKVNCLKVVHVHATSTEHEILHKMLYKRFIKSYDYALACSCEAGDWLFKNSEYKILNNGIEGERYIYNSEIREKLRNKNNIENKFILLHIGLFTEHKNQSFLIDTFNELLKREPTAQLRLVGQGNLLEEMRNKVTQLGIEKNVVFVGETDKPENEYLMADVFVFPSLFESFGLVTVEAQCSGLPCVLSDALPKKVKVNDNVEFLSLKMSPSEWAEKILEYKNSNVRKSCDEKIAECGFSIKHEAYRLTEFYKEIYKSK